MAIYARTPPQTLLDAIVAENPAFANATVDDLVFGTPTVVSGAQTRVKVRGKPGSGYTGVAIVVYNRINIATLFLNQAAVSVQQYNATTLSALLDRLNWLYGLNLQSGDLNTNPTLSGTSQTVALNLTPSLQYYGSVNVAWTKGTAAQLWELYPVRTLTALRVPTLMLKAFQVDYSANAATLTAHDTSVAFTSGSATAQAIVDLLAESTGLAVTVGATTTPGSALYDLSGFTLSRVDASQLTDANPNYRKIAVLTPPANFGLESTTIYMHYDKITTGS